MMSLISLSSIVVRPAGLFLVAIAASLVLARASAASRHLVWAVAIVGALCLPLAGLALPQWSVATPAAVATIAGIVADDRGGTDSGTAVSSHVVEVAPAAGPVAAERSDTLGATGSGPGEGTGWRVALVWLWLAGIGLVLGTFGAQRIGLARHEARWREVRSGPLWDAMDGLKRRMRVQRPVRLLLADAGVMPMTWGIRRPRIVLPAEASSWPRDRVDAILLHELAHVRRGDVLMHALAEFARAVYWFNPLAWFAHARLVAERERSCDDEAILAGLDPAAYAHGLLEMAGSLRAARAMHAALPMARRSQISGRLLRVLDASGRRRVRSLPGVLLAAALGAATVGVLSALQPVAPAADAGPDAGGPPASSPAPPQSAEAGRDDETPGAPSPSVQSPPDASVGATRLPGATPSCWPARGPGLNRNRNEERGVQTAEWRTADCEGSLLFDVPITVNGDTTRLVAIRGRFRLDERRGGIRRVIEATADDAGSPLVRATVDGRTVDAATAARWLGSVLGPVLRFTGVDVDVARHVP